MSGSQPLFGAPLLLTILIASSGLVVACGANAAGNTDPIQTATATEASGSVEPAKLARLEPEAGVYFGVNLDWSNDSAAAFNARVGQNAAVYVQFVGFPFAPENVTYLDGFFEQVAEQQGIALLTLEPTLPLEQIDAPVADAFAVYLADVKDQYDVELMIRFAHEMNGAWYSWSQQPQAYIAAFRTMSDAVHHAVPDAAMLWAPNYGAGYPFSGGQYEAKPGNPDFELLDTNDDGQLDMRDDPYAPYYPGDDVVDWVGISLYHWGSAWPWGENEAPENDKFVDQLTGNYQGLSGDERVFPSFYAQFAEQRGKPLAIVETAALYNPNLDGATAMEIKRPWWQQIYSADVRRQYPQIKMINWFEWDKFEVEIDGRLDWTLTKDDAILRAFLDDFENEAYVFAPLP